MKHTGKKLTLCLTLLLCLTLASAGTALALTPAGTEIRNQSVATYEDGDGNPYITSSNEVITVVDNVYSFEITPNKTGGTAAPGNYDGTPALTQAAAPGSTVYYSYYLTNTGNAPDTYNLARSSEDAAPLTTAPVGGTAVIYYDANGNGAVDPGDYELTAGGVAMGIASWGGTATPVVDADETISLILAYQVSVSASDGDEIDADIDGRSAGDNAVTDGVSNLCRTTVADGKGILTVKKAVDLTEANEGDTLTYTLSGSNTGNDAVQGRAYTAAGAVSVDYLDAHAVADASGILITDIFPAELNPGTGGGVPATSINVLSSAPNSAVVLYTDDGADWFSDLADVGNITGIALFIPDATPGDTNNDDALAVGQGYSLKFEIDIDTPLNNTTIVNNAAAGYYDGANQSVDSNDARTRIGGDPNTLNGDISIGPMDDPTDAGGVVAKTSADHIKIDDPLTDQAETLSAVGGSDRMVTVGDRHAGQTVYFVNTVINNSGTVDTVDITYAKTSLDADYVVELMKSDGLTPLMDTDGDGVPDTGPMAIGATYNVVVKVAIPGDEPDNGGNQDITLTAVSSVDPTVSDTTVDRIASVLQVAVDIALHDAGNAGANTGDNSDAVDVANDYPAGQNVNPGAHVDFALDVENVYPNGTETGARDTFDLSVGGIPAGWTVVLYNDANGNGTLEDDELLPIEDTGDLNPGDGNAAAGTGEYSSVIARVQVPAGYTAGLQTLTVTATSKLNGTVSDAVNLAVTVNSVQGIKIEPDNSRVSVAGGVVLYKHQVTNIGNTLENWELSLNSSAGWNAVFVAADGTTIEDTATIGTGAGADYAASDAAFATAGTLDPGESIEITVKVFVPTNAAVGTIDVLTVTVGDALVGPAESDFALDTTTVIEGNLQLEKTVTEVDGIAKPTLTTQAPQAAGNDYHPLEYVTTYTNLGADNANTVVLTDAIPAHTRLIVTSSNLAVAPSMSAAGTISYSNNGGLSFVYVPVAAGDGTDSDVTHIRYTVTNAVAPGVSGTVTFRVLID